MDDGGRRTRPSPSTRRTKHRRQATTAEPSGGRRTRPSGRRGGPRTAAEPLKGAQYAPHARRRGRPPPPRPQPVADYAAAQRTPPARLTLATNTRQPLRQWASMAGSAATPPVGSTSAIARPAPKVRTTAHAPANWAATNNACDRAATTPPAATALMRARSNLTSRRKNNNPPNTHSSSQCRPWTHHKATLQTACHPWC